MTENKKPEKKMLKALAGETQDIPPIWMMRQAGRFLPEYRETRAKAGSFLNLCYSPELATEVTLQPIRRFGFDASILFSDILVIPDALGQQVTFKEGVGPLLDPITDTTGLRHLSASRLHDHLAPVYETIRRLAHELPKETTLIGFAGAPWTVATYMVGGKGSKDQAETKAWAFSDPEAFQELMDLLTESTIEYVCRQIECGAEVIQIFDTWAGSLPETAFRQWVIGPAKRIVDGIKSKFPEVPVIGFPRGAGPLYEDFVMETGVNAVSIDSGMKISWAKNHIQNKVTVQGNLDPLLLVAGGKAMEAEVDRLLETFQNRPYIFNLGHGIVPQTPPEHVAHVIDRIRNR